MEALKQSTLSPAVNSFGKIIWECAGDEMGDVGDISFVHANEGINLVVPLEINDKTFRLYGLNCGRDIEENTQGYVEGFETYNVTEFISGQLADRTAIFTWNDSAFSSLTAADMPRPLSSIANSNHVVGDFLSWAAHGLAAGFNEFGRQGARENPRETYEVLQQQWLKMIEVIAEYSE